MPQLHLCRTRRMRYFKPIAFQLIYNELLVLLDKQNTRSEESEIPELPNQRISSLAQNGPQGKLNTWRNTADRGISELNLKKTRVITLCKSMYLFKVLHLYLQEKIMLVLEIRLRKTRKHSFQHKNVKQIKLKNNWHLNL